MEINEPIETQEGSSHDEETERNNGLIMQIDKQVNQGENMLPVHFMPEGKKCYDWINDDLKSDQSEDIQNESNQSKNRLQNKITYSQADMNNKNDTSNIDITSKLLNAAENNNLETVKDILKESPYLVNSTDRDGYTALHRASYSGHVNMVETLLEHNANIHARTIDGWQPLHCASRWNHVDVAHLLLKKNADVNSKTNGSQTPLHFASLSEDNWMLLEMFLLQPTIDVNIVNGAGDTAYDCALRSGPQVQLFEIKDEAMNI